MNNPVDLGLSACWADSNIGSSSPEDPGQYFAWGETSSKKEFDRNSYRFKPEEEVDFNVDDDYYEYRGFTKYHEEDLKTKLETNDDAAAIRLGDGWKIPTRQEWQELIDHCDWIWDPAKKGYKVVSRINGNGIFLPLSGLHFFDGLEFGDSFEGLDTYGLYWTSELSDEDISEAQSLFFEKQKIRFRKTQRESGLVIRAVWK